MATDNSSAMGTESWDDTWWPDPLHEMDPWAQGASGDDWWTGWNGLGALERASLQAEADLGVLEMCTATTEDWVRLNLDTGAAVNVFPMSFAPAFPCLSSTGIAFRPVRAGHHRKTGAGPGSPKAAG